MDQDGLFSNFYKFPSINQNIFKSSPLLYLCLLKAYSVWKEDKCLQKPVGHVPLNCGQSASWSIFTADLEISISFSQWYVFLALIILGEPYQISFLMCETTLHLQTQNHLCTEEKSGMCFFLPFYLRAEQYVTCSCVLLLIFTEESCARSIAEERQQILLGIIFPQRYKQNLSLSICLHNSFAYCCKVKCPSMWQA